MHFLAFIFFVTSLCGPALSPALSDDKVPGEGAKIISLNEYRLRKQYKQLSELVIEIVAEAPPIDHSAHYRQSALNQLSDALDRIAGKESLADFADLLEALKQDSEQARLSPEDRAKVVERFLNEASPRVWNGPGKKDLAPLVERLVSPVSGGEALLRIATRAHAGVESEFYEKLLRSTVQNTVRTPYSRSRLLDALEPALARHLDRRIIDALSDISRSEWLPFDVSGGALRLLRRWERNGVAFERNLLVPVRNALNADLPPVRRPLRVCAQLLLGK